MASSPDVWANVEKRTGYQGFVQWRRQGLMVGEAHLVGEASIFNVKYIIHECGLPTICRPPPGRYLLGRYT